MLLIKHTSRTIDGITTQSRASTRLVSGATAWVLRSIDSILIIRAVSWEKKAYDWDTWTRCYLTGYRSLMVYTHGLRLFDCRQTDGSTVPVY
jgi:hypothetical protein